MGHRVDLVLRLDQGANFFIFQFPKSMVPAPNLDRFLAAQEDHWEYVLKELATGKKRSHWMWFVFPQYRGLGSSNMSRRFAIQSTAEATAYIRHPILGSRLRECCTILLGLRSSSAFEVFGTPDDLKLRASMTLFDEVSASDEPFAAVLEAFFEGQRDFKTIGLIGLIEGGKNVE
jgi:uncharacterized protein (DUF1810 family)